MALMHRLRRDETITDEAARRAAVAAPGLVPAPGLAHRATVGRPPAATVRAAGPGVPLLAPAALPPSVARVAARTRLSAELLAAILEVDSRQRATLDDIERADALAERLLARRADRQRAVAAGRPTSQPRAAQPQAALATATPRAAAPRVHSTVTRTFAAAASREPVSARRSVS